MKILKKFQLTIGREYGCGAKLIADAISKALDIPVFDRNLIAMIAKKHGFDEDALTSSDERLAIPFFEPYSSYGTGTGSIAEKLFIHQAQIIKEEADKGPSIFVGRCANDILRHYPDVVNVFIYAPKEYRINRIMEVEDIADAGAAEKIIRRMDKTRRSYYQFYTDKRWGTKEGMDLMIDSASIGFDGAVSLIEHYLKCRGYIED